MRVFHTKTIIGINKFIFWYVMNISSKTKIAGVIGDPISHSLSPYLHNYLLEKNKIDGIYLPLKISANDLKSCLNALAKMGFKGCNVTIPHKESAYKICDEVSEEAKLIGAVNTIIIDERQKLHGHNSDGKGFINNIKNHYPDFDFEDKKVVVLGAGGAARALCYSLMKEKVAKIIITNRSLERAENLIKDFKIIPEFKTSPIISSPWPNREEILSDCDLLINTTSLGMQGGEELALDLSKLKKSALVCDIVYKPLMTELLILAKNRGNKIVTGIGMLINQALIGFEAWYGIKPEIDQKLISQMIKWSKES